MTIGWSKTGIKIATEASLIRNELIAYANSKHAWKLNMFFQFTNWNLYSCEDRIKKGEFVHFIQYFNETSVCLVGFKGVSSPLALNVNDFRNSYTRDMVNEKRKLAKKASPDIRKSDAFKNWAAKFLIPGDIVKMVGTRGSPFRRVEKVESSRIVGRVLDHVPHALSKLDTFKDLNTTTENGLDKLSMIRNTTTGVFESIIKVYKDVGGIK